MHILFVEHNYPNLKGEQGGAGTYVRNIGLGMVKRGHKVSVLMGGDPLISATYRLDEGIKVFPLKIRSRLAWYLSKIPILRVIIFPLVQYLISGYYKYIFIGMIHKKTPIDLIEYSSTGDFWQSIFKSIPYVVHLHGSSFTLKSFLGAKIGFGEKLMNRFECFFYKNAKMVFSPSKWMLDLVEKENRKSFIKSKILKYPIEINFNYAEIKKIDTGKVIFFMAARNDETKGWPQLLKAISYLNASYMEKSEFIFFGYKPPEDLKLNNNIKIYQFSKRSKVLEKLKSADVSIVPSHVDNSPNTIYEAMSLGKPVIGSDIAGIPELVQNGKTGLLFNPMDPVQLSAAIIYMVENHHKIIEFGHNALEYINKECNLKKNVDIRLRLWSN